MKASPRQQLLLLDLQDLDTGTARLMRKRQQIPERAELESFSGEMSDVREQFMTAQRELDGLRADLARSESDVATVAERRRRDERLLEASTSSKEAQALQSELETLARRTATLEDRELELMEAVEASETRFASAETALSELNERRGTLLAAIAAAERAIDADLARTAKERDGVAAELQRDLLDLYEITRKRVGIGAARLRGNVSEASNMALAPGELANIRAAAPDDVVYCPGTGAILVRVDESAS
ncbi:C4-type zinc ribbon domain-containing protein [Leucobacter tardus]|uniref:CT398-like coiled coil hairpin domain-containing protein n=1 Tax=Leucobacter tardus TaxID=501483 RepID=A0A939TN35_9MICO|nr:hypothetical protein [Leucobacter tardus]MBO2990103.1 hypothetical protein [Leucobacter tardus]